MSGPDVFAGGKKAGLDVIAAVQQASKKTSKEPSGRKAFVESACMSLLLALVAHHGKLHEDHIQTVVDKVNLLADKLGY